MNKMKSKSMKKISVFLLSLFAWTAQSQFVINEVDVDQTGTDTQEFIELKGTPGFSLSGYVMVLFNGNNATEASYFALGLTGSIPASGYFVIGNPLVPNVNQIVDPGASGAFQNGADAVAIYQGTAAAWPNGTSPTLTGAVDAVVYGTDDADDTGLLGIFVPGQIQVNESPSATTSSSRIPDGGTPFNQSVFSAQTPTPGASNSGEVAGCMDVTACNFNANATSDDGSCATVGDACDDGNAGTAGDAYDASCQCIGEISGCMDASACNYNAAAVLDDGSCALPGDACNDNNGATINDVYDASCICIGEDSGQSTVVLAEQAGVGATVTVTGIITNGVEMGSSVRYIQDFGGGLAIYPGTAWTTFTAPNRGDLVTVTGTLSEFGGLLELGPTLTAVTVNATNQTLPTPQLITPAQLGESLEGELVTVENVVFDLAGTPISGNSTYNFTSNGEQGAIYVRAGSVLVGVNLPASAVTLVGIASQYDPASPFDSGYQILPRDENDFILPPGVAILGQVVQENINTTSFDLTWATNNPGNSQVNYGLTPALGQTVVVNDNVTDHTVTVTGLEPGTIYYCSVTSTNADGSSSSTVRPYATKSLSSGEIRVYFNRQVDTTYATVENALSIGAGSNDSIAAYINRAQQSVDIAIYNFTDDAVIANAINNRFNAGVQVRVVSDGSTAQMGLGLLNPAIPIVERINTTGTGIMHNKFLIVDADDADNAWVWTGSMNWTDNNLYNDYNNIIIFQDQSVARGYRLEFEEMWGGSGPNPGVANGVFGSAKSANTPTEYVLGPNNIRVESYFSPTDNANGAIIRSMQTTDANLDYAVLAFTRQDIADAIIAEDDLFLVLVRGIIEQTSDPASEYGYLQTAGQDVRSHEGITYDVHHKYLIVDHSSLDSDPLVLTGSHNWSSAAQTTNDENTVIVHDARVANLYLQEFMNLWGTEPASVENATDGTGNMYPNPAENQLWIALPKGVQNANVFVFNQSGQMVQEFAVGQGLQSVQLAGLSSGVYHFQVVSEGRSWNKQVIVK
jgi:phosphatidylserine/phosphatidylglycerophosphate/cardiolipin synthase-like enzyme